MIRRLFIAASAVSLPLCVATVVLWVHSSRIYVDELSHYAQRPNGITWWIEAHQGHVEVVFGIDPTAEPNDVHLLFNALTCDPDEPFQSDAMTSRHLGSFLVGESNCSMGNSPVFKTHVYDAPLWSLLVITLILPSAWIGKVVLHVRRRRRTGHCPACGYDLRASTARCPECGTPIQQNVGSTV